MKIPVTLALLATFAVPALADNGETAFFNSLTEIQGTTGEQAREQRFAAH